jgi:hypothetical protein
VTDLTDAARQLRARIDAAAEPADANEARAARAALTKLAADATAARNLATQFRNSTSAQKNTLVADRFDDVLDALADHADMMARLIRAVVREQ